MGGDMRLRNKKTGEIKEYTHTMTSYHVPIKGGYEIFTPWYPEEWEELEDVKEPLIKDEKIRKAVRAWAEASEITKVLSYGDYFWIGFRSVNTESVWKFECSYSDASEFELDKEYTIAELCGEEKE